MKDDIEYYSQHGEDYVVDKFFNYKEYGLAIEVGALDGQRLSVTYSLENFRKWKTICIEAHKLYFNMLVANRSSDCINIHAAISDSDEEEITFYANSRGALSSIEEKFGDTFSMISEYFSGFEKQKVKSMTLNTLFENYLTNEEKYKIDCLSIDVDGTELRCLKGFDIKKYQPTIIIIENNDPDGIKEYMINNNYFYVSELGCNSFYINNQENVNSLKLIIDGYIPHLKHSKHPLD